MKRIASVCTALQVFPPIFYAVSTKSVLLTWTHYRTLLQMDNDEACEWYARETTKEMWSVCTLQRNISSQYYFCLLQSQHKELVEKEI